MKSVGGPLGGDEKVAEAPADRFSLGETGGVRVAAAVPNALSPAATLTIPSGHQPIADWGVARLEAAVIAAGPVIFGPGPDSHVRVRAAAGTLLFRPGPDGWQVRGADGGPGGDGGGSAALGWRAVAAGESLADGGVSLRLAAVPGP